MSYGPSARMNTDGLVNGRWRLWRDRPHASLVERYYLFRSTPHVFSFDGFNFLLSAVGCQRSVEVPIEVSQRVSDDHLVLELHQDEAMPFSLF